MATLRSLPAELRALFGEMKRFAIGPGTYGTRVERNRIVLGMVTDFSIGAEPLLHETAHAIEIDLPRLGLPGWGLKTSSPLGRLGDQAPKPPSSADVHREMRVLAIQANLHELFGLPFLVKSSALPLRHLAGWGTFVNESGCDGSFGGYGVAIESTMLPRIVDEYRGVPDFTADRSLAMLRNRDRILDRELGRLRPELTKRRA